MIGIKDFGKYVLPKQVKYIDVNVAKAMKNAEWSLFFTEGSIDREYVESKQVEAMGPARVVARRAPLPELTLEEGYAKRKTVTEYGAMVTYDKARLKLGGEKYIKMCRDGLTNSPAQLLDNIGMAYVEFCDTAIASVPKVNGRPMIDTLSGDGLTIAHATHTFPDSDETYATKLTYSALTQETVQTGVNTVMLWKNNTGRLIQARVTDLRVPVGQQAKAYELLHSETKSETANRADNALRKHFGKMGFTVVHQQVNQVEYSFETNCPNDFEFLFAWKPDQETEYIKGLRAWAHYLDFAVAHGVNDPRRHLFVKQA